MGLCFVVNGKYDEAVRAHRVVLQWREAMIGASGEQILQAYNHLGEALNWQGNWPTTEIYLQRAVQERTKILGCDHPDTLTSMANLASTYQPQFDGRRLKR